MADQDPFSTDTPPGAEPGGFETPPSGGVAWGGVFFFILTILVVVFAVQNTDPAPVKFLWWEGRFPLAIVILATAAAAVIITELGAIVYRRRRKRRIADKEELKQYRKAARDS